MNHLTVETEDNFASLLELAANNDVEKFKNLIEQDPSAINEVGLWYGRQKGSKQMVLEHRTPLMVASMYGSIDVLKLILSLSESSVNKSYGIDKTTALHCAASSGSKNAADVIKLLITAGADLTLIDANGHRPIDTIVVSPRSQDLKYTLEDLLSTATSASNSPKKKEYAIDPSLPDIKYGVYSTDEFRMFSFKVRPCSRAYSHDWTECPFVHPGENARRRDPRKYHYSCVPCPDFRKSGSCRRGDMCEFAHGVFECWLHPAQYRTRLCKDGTSCNRRVCFFAHTQDQLRPLYVPSPRSSSAALSPIDFAAAMTLLAGPVSPSGWTLPPTLHLQSSRLTSSFNNPVQDFGQRSPLTRSNLDDLLSPRLYPTISPRHPLRSLGPVSDSWTQWGSTNGKVNWAVNDDDYGKIRRSSSFEIDDNFEDEPDLSWVQSLVKENTNDTKEICSGTRESIESSGAAGGSSSSDSREIEHGDQSAVLGAWIEQFQLDQLVAQ